MKVQKEARLDALLRQQPLIWKASEQRAAYQHTALAGLDTGFEALNRLLITGGWPRASLVEIVVDEWGQGELQLLLPAMAALSREQQQLAWIAPPYIPYAPALSAAGIDLGYLLIIEHSETADIAWAAEKCLRHAAAAMVLFCLPRVDDSMIRRLQLAADSGGTTGFLLHCGRIRQTPVALRLRVSYTDQGMCVEVLKSRFGLEQGKRVIIELDAGCGGMPKNE